MSVKSVIWHTWAVPVPGTSVVRVLAGVHGVYLGGVHREAGIPGRGTQGGYIARVGSPEEPRRPPLPVFKELRGAQGVSFNGVESPGEPRESLLTVLRARGRASDGPRGCVNVCSGPYSALRRSVRISLRYTGSRAVQLPESHAFLRKSSLQPLYLKAPFVGLGIDLC